MDNLGASCQSCMRHLCLFGPGKISWPHNEQRMRSTTGLVHKDSCPCRVQVSVSTYHGWACIVWRGRVTFSVL